MKDTAIKKNNSYSAILLCEATRFFEQAHTQESAYAEAVAKKRGGDFSQRLYKRAQHLDSAAFLQAAIDSLHNIQQKLYLLFGLVIFLSGYFFAKVLLLAQNDQGANIYVLLTALVLPNFFSLLFFVFLHYKKAKIEGFNIANIMQFFLAKLAGYSNFFKRAHLAPKPGKTSASHAQSGYLKAALKAWQNMHVQGAYAQQSFALLSHSLWLIFLVGALVAIVFRLSAHHYFFGWESTLLSEGFFINITHALSVPLSIMNIAVPTIDQVAQSNLKNGFAMNAAISKYWSYFLIAAFVFYAVIPRFLFVIYFLIKSRSTRNRLTLNTRHLAYASLYQKLMLHESLSVIVDEDQFAAANNKNIKQALNADSDFDIARLKKGTPYLSIESDLAEITSPVLKLSDSTNYLGAALDRESQKALLERLNATAAEKVIVIISLLSVPERGITRYLQQLQKIKPQLIVFLIEQEKALQRFSSDDFSQRLYDWHIALNEMHIEQKHIAITNLDDAELAARLTGST